MNLPIRYICLVALIFLVIGCAGIVPKQSNTPCTTTDEVASSITVEQRALPLVGLNADTDSLNFGVVSRKASVKRSINAQYSKKAEVSVSMEGDFSGWVSIEPSEFSLDGNPEKVTFTVDVPQDAEEGIYTGRIMFCFRE